MNIKMLDLKGQYDKIKSEIDNAIQGVLNHTGFIQGAEVAKFENNLGEFTGSEYVISCANGTDALQIAMMALDLKPGDEVIVPAFTYVATAEVIALLGLIPVLVDVDPQDFNISINDIERSITKRTKAIVPVHLFGQSADMEPIMEIAKKHSLYVIEDVAQALGAQYRWSSGKVSSCGTIGDIGCTSFFPSKNLGCFGDGGAIFTSNKELAKRIKMIANHGQEKKYYHDLIGCNSRLDTLQAAILDVKLKYLKGYQVARQKCAENYRNLLSSVEGLTLPKEFERSTHVYHQFTLKIDKDRSEFVDYLKERGVPTMIYYPLPLHKQKAFEDISIRRVDLLNSECLSKRVVSLPIHTELTLEEQNYISDVIIDFFKAK